MGRRGAEDGSRRGPHPAEGGDCRSCHLPSSDMDIILVPGLWLTARSWDDVVPRLEDAGHTTHPLTLPGMEALDADRSGVARQDHVDAVVAAIDATEGDPKVLLVGHSMGGVLAWAAADARLHRTAGVVFLASEPGIPEESESMFPVKGDEV